mmetsp:Transcript_36143/g.115741  ORF Transcript_36143/g.115741 Transcript_36143/m.115741 type:complete len:238 (+) Transcript_36143:568-1281(+)
MKEFPSYVEARKKVTLILLLLSALSTGRSTPTDPLCGDRRLPFATWTMRDMADHWGNLLFRETLFFRDLAVLAATNAAYADEGTCSPWPAAESGNRSGTSLIPWFVWRHALRRMGCGDEPERPAGRANLEVVVSHIEAGRLYDAVGIVEHFDEATSLFDCRVPLWWTTTAWGPLLARHTQSHHSARWKDDERRAVDHARTDPYVRDKLQADIRIYDAAVRVFRRSFAPGGTPTNCVV